jgi:hypothetical protein
MVPAGESLANTIVEYKDPKAIENKDEKWEKYYQ